MQKHNRLYAAGKASILHIGISACIAFFSAILVLFIWFPYPYRNLSGGLHLFWIMIGIDVVCGPLLTLVLFNPKKSKKELALDLSFIALIQIMALTWGLYSISLARPVIAAFETDRFTVVSAAEIDPQQLSKAPYHLRSLSWTGPRLIGTRRAHTNEIFKSIELSLQGIGPASLPDWWQPYEINIPDVKQRMKKLDLLYATRSEKEKIKIDKAVKQTGKRPDQLYYLPLTNRKKLDEWIVLLDNDAQIVGYVPIGGF